MEKRNPKFGMDYSNLSNYNPNNWNAATYPYVNPLYFNTVDSTLQNVPNQQVCPVICTQPNNSINSLELYSYGLVPSQPVNYSVETTYRYPNSAFLLDNYKPLVCNINPRCTGTETYQIPSPAPQVIQRSGPMRAWLHSHLNDPYPSPQEKQKLAEECNKTYVQVCTWFANARRSLRRQGHLGPRMRSNKAMEVSDSISTISPAAPSTQSLPSLQQARTSTPQLPITFGTFPSGVKWQLKPVETSTYGTISNNSATEIPTPNKTLPK